MTHYILSPQAQQSLKNIRGYTLKNFGKQQTKLYLEKLRDRMKCLAENPTMGKVRDDIKSGYYCYLEASHTIYYRIGNERIEIIDVLHQSMDPERHI